MGNIIERMAAIASMYVAAGSAYVERRMYKGNPSTKPDPKKKRKRKAERAARRINRK